MSISDGYQEDPMKCCCQEWARNTSVSEEAQFELPHHPDCMFHGMGDLREAQLIIGHLLWAMNRWGADEDGIHHAAVKAYNRGAKFIGEKELEAE